MNKFRMLAICGLWWCVGVVSAQTLDDLATEAGTFASDFRERPAKSLNPAQVAQLQAAAVIMQEGEDCRTAMQLRQRALRSGGSADHPAWLGLGRAAACARAWPEGSRAAWLALQASADDAQRLAAWALLGETLEQRTGWQQEWRQSALEAYDQALKLRQVPWVAERAGQLRKALDYEAALRVADAIPGKEGNSAGLCFKFNAELASSQDYRYEDYLRFQPEFSAVWSVSEATLCAYGAAYGQEYRVLIRKGLSAQDKSLTADVQLTLATGHREPALWFKQSSYVLPAANPRAVPLFSVNTAHAKLELYRLHERNLLSEFVQQHFKNNLDGFSLNNLKDAEGEWLWRGEVTLNAGQDVVQATDLPLPEALLANPGLYVLAASDSKADETTEWQERATQWLVVSDIGLTAYQGEDGLTLAVRSLKTGEPQSGVELVLYARNNSPLSRQISDARGLAYFAPGLVRGEGGRVAALLTAEGGSRGFNFLQLGQPALDLSDRGVAGRAAPGPLDAYLYTERGIYRPGETVNVTGLLRDERGRAINGLPLRYRLKDQAGEVAAEAAVIPGAAGVYRVTRVLGRQVQGGRWTLELYAEHGESPLGQVDFLVEAVAPPRLEASLTAPSAILPGQTVEAVIQARYLFGAPGAALRVLPESLIEADPTPFATYPGYRFGPVDETFAGLMLPMEEALTGPDGTAALPLHVEATPNSRRPLRVKLQAAVLDVDGRQVSAETLVSMRHLPLYIGILPGFANDRAGAHQAAQFQVVALDPSGQPTAAKLGWRLVAEEADYQWFQRDGIWGYERLLREHPLSKGQMSTSATATALQVPVGEGSYRLEVFDEKQALVSAVRFQAGDRIVGQADTPDALGVSADRARHQVGDLVRLHVRSSFDGPASLVLANTRIQDSRAFTIVKGEAELDIPVTDAWGAGVYALVTEFRPGDKATLPGRALGVLWLGVEPVEQQLRLALQTPERVTPRQTLEVPLRVQGQQPGEPVFVTLAAVDDGILQLTDFQPPDPLKYFFGQRRLGTEVRDLYGQLIESGQARPGVLRQGAGDGLRRGAPPGNIEILSEFTGPVAVPEDGVARIPLRLPDFNGRVRLMAVAWSQGKLGATHQPMVVRDPLVVVSSLPRFLALGDHGELNLHFHNMEAPVGDYQLKVESGAGVSLTGAAVASLRLEREQRQVLRVPLQADALGEGWLRVTLDGPEAYHYERHLTLGIRGRYLAEQQRQYRQLAPGQTLEINASLVAGLETTTAKVEARLSARPALDVAALLDQLQQYPYGCLEQTVSRALPLLYADELQRRWGAIQKSPAQPRVQAAISRALEHLRWDGRFGLWSSRDEDDLWLSAFTMDFLLRARAAGYEVPDYSVNKALDALWVTVREQQQPDATQLADLAYAHYVLARAGKPRLAEVRYLWEQRRKEFSSALGLAHLGATLLEQGERVRGRAAFAAALAFNQRKPNQKDYGSTLRDLAATLSVMQEAGAEAGDPAAGLQELARLQQAEAWLSTQEQTWLLMAARHLQPGGVLKLNVDGQDAGGETLTRTLDQAQLQKGMKIKNLGKEPAWVSLYVQGTPTRKPAVRDQGIGIQRTWFDLAGNPVNPSRLRQGDLLVTLLEGKAEVHDDLRLLLVDLLPAGLEMDNPHLQGAQELGQLTWLPELASLRYSDALDDRFVAALDLPARGDNEPRAFTLAYLTRVVTPGSYLWPPAEVEDMYRPRWRAQSAEQPVEVVAP